MLGFAVAAAIGVFLLLQAAFRSWRLAILAFLALPAALVGGVLAAFAGGGLTSLGSMAGLLAVFAIAARNGVLLINHYQHLEQHEGEVFGIELVLRGARERLAPILITAIATGLALLPFVVLGDIAGLEIVHPMAIVILGGLVTSTLLSLFVIPALYLRFGSSAPDVGHPALVLRRVGERWTVGVLVIGLLIIAVLQLSACGGTSKTSGKIAPAAVEHIEGTDLDRVILSAKAAERLGIETAAVRDEDVSRKSTVGGEVVDSTAIEGADGGSRWVRVALSEAEYDEVDRDKPAVVMPVAGDDGMGGRFTLTAHAVEVPALDEPEGATAMLYYAVDSAGRVLAPGQRVLVELSLSSSLRKVVPYASVIYDLQGDTWTYANPEPLAFVRHRIIVDYIDGDLAFLLDGPPVGTAVVVVGAAELLGVELGVGQ